MAQCDYSAPWYHGSPEQLNVLRKGSWVTQFLSLAKAFSHKPTLISMDDDIINVKHNGAVPGFLYTIAEPVGPGDVTYRKNTAQSHWQTGRDLRLQLVAMLPMDEPPQLSEEEIAAVRKDIPEGTTGMVCSPDEG